MNKAKSHVTKRQGKADQQVKSKPPRISKNEAKSKPTNTNPDDAYDRDRQRSRRSHFFVSVYEDK